MPKPPPCECHVQDSKLKQLFDHVCCRYSFHFNFKGVSIPNFGNQSPWLNNSLLATGKKKKSCESMQPREVLECTVTKVHKTILGWWGPVVCKVFCGDLHIQIKYLLQPYVWWIWLWVRSVARLIHTAQKVFKYVSLPPLSVTHVCETLHWESHESGYRHAAKDRKASWNTVLHFDT